MGRQRLEQLLGELFREDTTGANRLAKGAPAADWETIRTRLRTAQRRSWIPLIADGDGAPASSKLSGIPVLSAEEPWPVCPNCKREMQLFVQLRGDQMPEKWGSPWGGGFLQLFYCTSTDPFCEVECEAFFPFSRSTLARVLDAETEPAWERGSPVADGFPPRQIVGWRPEEDFPSVEECSALGLSLSDPERVELERQGFPLEGEKLGGWPAWHQGVDYPHCPSCGESMEFLFQIDSEHNLPHMFGDLGSGQIFGCPKHPRSVAFGWSCA